MRPPRPFFLVYIASLVKAVGKSLGPESMYTTITIFLDTFIRQRPCRTSEVHCVSLDERWLIFLLNLKKDMDRC